MKRIIALTLTLIMLVAASCSKADQQADKAIEAIENATAAVDKAQDARTMIVAVSDLRKTLADLDTEGASKKKQNEMSLAATRFATTVMTKCLQLNVTVEQVREINSTLQQMGE